MRHVQWLAAAAILAAGTAAHAEHFEYRISLTGQYLDVGTSGCTDDSGCLENGALLGTMSFDTPSGADGNYAIDGNVGDITNFYVSLGGLSSDVLYGGVDMTNGIPSGVVQSLDQTEYFNFDWGQRLAIYDYDYGYHEPSGQFSGSLSAIPEPGGLALLLLGVVTVAGVGRRRAVQARRA